MTGLFIGAIVLALVTVGVEAADGAPVHTVDRVDLQRYVGDWFEQARFPNRFQRQCAGDVRATYATRSDGRLDVTNQCRRADGAITEAKGVARVVDEMTSAKLEVRFAPAVLSFLPFVWGDYWVIGLADDYSWAVVGTPGRDYLWVLSRARSMAPGAYSAALEVAKENGFDVMRLERTRQDLGAAGDEDQSRR